MHTPGGSAAQRWYTIPMLLRPILSRALPFALLALVAGLALFAFTRARAPEYQTARVTRGAIVGEALASGNVESPTTAKLRFLLAGKLALLPARVGRSVAPGALLAKQDTSVLDAQLAQALSDVAAQEAQLQALLDGTRPEAIAVSEAQVAADAGAAARAAVSEADAIRNAYTAADSAVRNALDPLFSNPGSANPKLAFPVSDTSLQNALETGRVPLGATLAALATQVAALDAAAPAPLERPATDALRLVSDALAQASAALTAAIPSVQVSSAQLAAWGASIATARTSIATATAALTAAISAREAASATLARDEKTLALQRAGATPASLDAQRAAIAAAEARAAGTRAQIRNLEIRAPFSGTVTDTNGTPGETIGPETVVVTLLPHQELEIVARVAEDSVVGVSLGDRVRIELDAFPRGTSFPGTVRSIAPAQTVEGGAISYETHIAFDEVHDDVRPGMSANAWIETASSSDALIVPASVLSRSATSTSVRVLSGGVPETRLVATGIESRDGSVQILSGLAEGDEVVIGQ